MVSHTTDLNYDNYTQIEGCITGRYFKFTTNIADLTTLCCKLLILDIDFVIQFEISNL